MGTQNWREGLCGRRACRALGIHPVGGAADSGLKPPVATGYDTNPRPVTWTSRVHLQARDDRVKGTLMLERRTPFNTSTVRFRASVLARLRAAYSTFNTSTVRFRDQRMYLYIRPKETFNTSTVRFRDVRAPGRCSSSRPFNTSTVRFRGYPQGARNPALAQATGGSRDRFRPDRSSPFGAVKNPGG